MSGDPPSPWVPGWVAVGVLIPFAAAAAALPMMLSLSATECGTGAPLFYPVLLGILVVAGLAAAGLLAYRGFTFWECVMAGVITVLIAAVLMWVEIFVWGAHNCFG